MPLRRLRPIALVAALAMGCAGQQDSADSADTGDTGAAAAEKGVVAAAGPGGGSAGHPATRARFGESTGGDVGPAGTVAPQRAGSAAVGASPIGESPTGSAADRVGAPRTTVSVLVVEGDETWLHDCVLPAGMTRAALFRDGLPADAAADLQCARDRQVGMRWPTDAPSQGSGRVGLTVSFGHGDGPALQMPITPSGDRAVDGTVKRYRARLARCLLAERSGASAASTETAWRLDIADGRVRDVALVDGAAGPAAFCVSETLAGWRFPKRVSEPVVLDLSFSRRGGS